VAEVSAPEALFGPTVVAAPVSEPAGTVAAETAETPPDIVPAQLRVIVVRRLKYACRASEEVVVQAPAPAQMIEGGLRPSRRSRGCW
jgi:transposase